MIFKAAFFLEFIAFFMVGLVCTVNVEAKPTYFLFCVKTAVRTDAAASHKEALYLKNCWGGFPEARSLKTVGSKLLLFPPFFTQNTCHACRSSERSETPGGCASALSRSAVAKRIPLSSNKKGL